MSSLEMNVPNLGVSDTSFIPQVGLGTWLSNPGDVGVAVRVAIETGYRHIDCAQAYGNEKEIGEAIAEKISDGTIKREDLYIVSKLWCTFHSKDAVRIGFNESLKALNTPYLDLFLMHHPYAFVEGTGEKFPLDEENKIRFLDVDYVETWTEMEKLVDEGLVRSIGISNFNSVQTERLLNSCSVKPVVNQVECHPYLNNEKLFRFCSQRGILLTAYAPLGSPSKPQSLGPKKADLLTDDVIVSMATRHSKTPAQILIRFAVQRGIVVIPKSTNHQRIMENISVFDFELSEDEMKRLMRLNADDGSGRGFTFDERNHSKFYPFFEEF